MLAASRHAAVLISCLQLLQAVRNCTYSSSASNCSCPSTPNARVRNVVFKKKRCRQVVHVVCANTFRSRDGARRVNGGVLTRDELCLSDCAASNKHVKRFEKQQPLLYVCLCWIRTATACLRMESIRPRRARF
ncbi:hypothetical protein IE81DRAFT_85404 [Ceraceosorus guamensis]|uniref:Secreted protein n=1 Tax=Ceraceosorus guamensis TaxID=1522189 RepID=A0A316W8K4_9BASI|nr:hypothetical protein IE81DRAFT_85404 [Ceraceosorus guamensis]PWN46162.1 hypothetical protein IE81DRAFT_85404 [Ceraceosorus guamensis]